MIEDRNRGAGRTKAMVEAMPATGAVIIVHSGGLRDYVRKMIVDLRGVEVWRKSTIRIIDHHGDVDDLRGERRPILVDHAFWDHAKPLLAHRIDVITAVQRLAS